MHKADRVQRLIVCAIKNQEALEGRLNRKRAQPPQLGMLEMAGPSQVRSKRKLGQRLVQRHLESPSHFHTCLVNIPGKHVFKIRHEIPGLLNGPAHWPCFSLMMRSPMERISSDEYGVNGPSMALSNSASSSGLSVSKSSGLCVSSQTCFSPSVRTITAP